MNTLQKLKLKLKKEKAKIRLKRGKEQQAVLNELANLLGVSVNDAIRFCGIQSKSPVVVLAHNYKTGKMVLPSRVYKAVERLKSNSLGKASK